MNSSQCSSMGAADLGVEFNKASRNIVGFEVAPG
jgi:hypothetical protein